MKRQNAKPCSDAGYWEPRLYAYAENEAPPEERAATEAHLKQCAYCKAQLDDILFMIDALRTEPPAMPDTLHDDIMRRVRATEDIPAADKNSPAPGETPLITMVRRQKATEKKQARIRLIGGLAAACVIAVGIWQLLPMLSGIAAAGSGEASKVLTDMQTQEAGDGSFIGGVFVGDTPPPTEGHKSPETTPETTEEDANDSILGSIFSIFSQKSEHATTAESVTEAENAPAVIVSAAASAEARIRDVLDTLSDDGILTYTETDGTYLVRCDGGADVLLPALTEKGIAMTISDGMGEDRIIEIRIR